MTTPHLDQSPLHPDLAPAQDGPRVHPGRADFREVQGVKELPVAALARLADQVDLGKPRERHVPPIGPEGGCGCFKGVPGFVRALSRC
jgi:hypothetical protein